MCIKRLFLGTLITEFDQGNELCDKFIFKNVPSMHKFAQSLAKLTKIFGFDGWLLNIENKVQNINVLKEFVPYFTALIHEDNPGNIVIWYDSVTVNGELKWQNELNEQNRYLILFNDKKSISIVLPVSLKVIFTVKKYIHLDGYC